MKQCLGKLVLLLCVVLVSGFLLPSGAAGESPGLSGDDGPPLPAGEAVESTRARLAALPLTFIPNRGQYDPAVAFVVTGPQSMLFFSPDMVVITAPAKDGDGTVLQSVRQVFPGASLHPDITGIEPLQGTASFLYGSDPSRWQAGVPVYGAVEYHDLYPGIDLRYRGREGMLKREFIIDPGSDPAAIRLRYEGIDGISVDGTGSLVLATGTGTLTESPPVCFQEINGKTVPVSAAYRVVSENEAAFTTGTYDPAFPLVIDPRLVYSTFAGGDDYDYAYAIAVDRAGNAYLTGETLSPGYPTTPGASDRTHTGAEDVFVTKLNAAGTDLVYSTFLGGSARDQGLAIAVDGSGNAYITGYTYSEDFPTTTGAYNRTRGGSGQGFVTKLNAGGSGLAYSTYLGGSGIDQGFGIAVDGSGRAYVTGETNSADFPTTATAYDRSPNGGYDIFVTKLNPAGSGLPYSTLIGGEEAEAGRGIAVDGDGRAYVTGETRSTGFPTTAMAFDRTKGGGNASTDGFVAKLNPAGSDLVYSTYLGGSFWDHGIGIALDRRNNTYVAGSTFSSDFPTTTGSFDRTYRGGDMFVTKLNAAGSGPVYSTFLGGSGYDKGYSIAVDTKGSAYLTGYTTSGDYPTTAGAVNRTFGGFEDAVVTKLNPAGTGLLYSTFLGGPEEEEGLGIAVTGNGNAYVGGYAYTPYFPVTSNAYDITYNGYYDVFMARFALPPRTSGVGVFHPANRTFILKNGTKNTTIVFGQSTDIPLTGDWNGDGLWDVGGYRPANRTFRLKNGPSVTTITYGRSTDIPLTGDWNGDGLWDVGVYRTANRTFFLKNGTRNTTIIFGAATDLPVTGDWNGDGLWDVGVFRPGNHTFLLKNGPKVTAISYGLATDTPVSGDWNGDGLWDVGTFRNSSGVFRLRNGAATITLPWGESGDRPVTGIWQ